MTPPAIHPIDLCGGSATRLWALSRKGFPLQFGPHCPEHWNVVNCPSEVTGGEETYPRHEDECVHVRLGEVHRLHNPGKTPLEMIEVQSGSYLGEDDIVRMDDHFGRVIPIAEGQRGNPPEPRSANS